MRRVAWLLALLLALLGTGTAWAQSTCGNGLPCGNVPWTLPGLPRLPSPTPIQADENGLVPTPPPESTDEPGNEIDLIGIDTSGITDQVATLNAIAAGTPIGVSNPDGSFNNPDMQATQQADMGQNSGLFFGYVRGLTDINFGVITPLLTFLLFAFALTFVVKGSTIILPIITVLLGFLRKIVQFILDFIPL